MGDLESPGCSCPTRPVSGRSRVLFVTPELDDFVKVGGLGAVSSALPRALSRWCDVRVVVPGYRQVLPCLDQMALVARCEAYAGLPACDIGRLETTDGLTVYAVLCPELYDREGTPYGDVKHADWSDNDVRFARFGLAAAELAAGSCDPDWAADLIHVNDWPSGLAPAYLAWRGINVPSILTIHNLAYQGLFARECLARVGAPESAFHINGVEFYNQFSFLKAGISYAKHITTVSESYSREITTPEFGCGLEGLLQLRASERRLTGILNGIDETWDPGTCSHLATPFEAGDWKGKRANADNVRRHFGLAVSRGPLFGLVARLVQQKGIDLVIASAESIVAAGGQIVVMGTGEGHLQESLQAMANRFPRSVSVTIGFEEGISRRIFAGSDFMLIPSRFEPCGLSQMYAQRFGTIPIGRKTGGLSETIEDGRTGFLFREDSAAGLLGAVCRAFSAFASKRHLRSMRLAAMARRFDWQTPAMCYDSLYQKVAGN
jgi:starch synthase